LEGCVPPHNFGDIGAEKMGRVVCEINIFMHEYFTPVWHIKNNLHVPIVDVLKSYLEFVLGIGHKPCASRFSKTEPSLAFFLSLSPAQTVVHHRVSHQEASTQNTNDIAFAYLLLVQRIQVDH
jgi:hypothetical protein